MTDHQAKLTSESIAEIFTGINAGMKGAIRQELERGKYDPERVLAWTNWRRSETAVFELTEMRKAFIADQPPKPVEGNTAQWLRTRDEIEAAYAADEPARKQQKDFFDKMCTADDLTQLRAEWLDTLDEDARRLCEGKTIASKFVRDGIWGMVQARGEALRVK
jgi:hypothetical protein